MIGHVAENHPQRIFFTYANTQPSLPTTLPNSSDPRLSPRQLIESFLTRKASAQIQAHQPGCFQEGVVEFLFMVHEGQVDRRYWITSNPCREIRFNVGECKALPAVLSVKQCESLIPAT